jgi:hypothetical protein
MMMVVMMLEWELKEVLKVKVIDWLIDWLFDTQISTFLGSCQKNEFWSATKRLDLKLQMWRQDRNDRKQPVQYSTVDYLRNSALTECTGTNSRSNSQCCTNFPDRRRSLYIRSFFLGHLFYGTVPVPSVGRIISVFSERYARFSHQSLSWRERNLYIPIYLNISITSFIQETNGFVSFVNYYLSKPAIGRVKSSS